MFTKSFIRDVQISSKHFKRDFQISHNGWSDFFNSFIMDVY